MIELLESAKKLVSTLQDKMTIKYITEYNNKIYMDLFINGRLSMYEKTQDGVVHLLQAFLYLNKKIRIINLYQINYVGKRISFLRKVVKRFLGL